MVSNELVLFFFLTLQDWYLPLKGMTSTKGNTQFPKLHVVWTKSYEHGIYLNIFLSELLSWNHVTNCGFPVDKANQLTLFLQKNAHECLCFHLIQISSADCIESRLKE